MAAAVVNYLIVPGWQGSADDHWQSHWQRCLPNARRVEQDDWLWPQPQAWVARLQESIEQAEAPVVLIAHSLGCITVARWAAQASAASQGKVLGALLVAPADVERLGCPEALQTFIPISRRSLPFPSVLVASDNDTAASAPRALQLARDWGSEAVLLKGVGHINTRAGFVRWEQGFAHLYRLQGHIEQEARLRA